MCDCIARQSKFDVWWREKYFLTILHMIKMFNFFNVVEEEKKRTSILTKF